MSNGSRETPRKDVAVYIDYENLYISLRSTVGKNPNFDIIMDKCREFGRLTITRAYADWSEFSRVVTSQLFASGVEPIYVPTRKFYDAKTRSQATKNSVDIHITIDIMKMVPTEDVDCFVLVSGDRDFVPLMNQIRAAGKEVYAIGVAGCTSSELALAVDEMFYYHQLLETDEELATEQRDVYQKLMRAVEIARARGYRATLGVVKPLMRELVVGFDERKFRNSKGVPFQKFKQLCQEAEKQGFIRLAEAGDATELLLAKDGSVPVVRAAEDRAQGRRPERAGGAERDGAERAPRQERPDRRPERVEARAESDDAVATDGNGGDSGPAAAEAVAEGSGGGRRRGRRGGRGRGRRGRGPGGDALQADGTSAAVSDEEASEDSDAAEDAADEAADDAQVAEIEGREAEDREAARRLARVAGARERAEDRAAERAQERAEDEGGDDDEDDDDAELPAGEIGALPAEAFDDLKEVMGTFVGRAPSQRRLIKQLKKEASSGDLKGEYKDGQFLLLVRKALQDGVLEKISKGFYSGLRLKGETGSATAE